ncbi:nitroreductase [Brevibacterium sp. VCM10]|uniref:nitroreductase n=1 Tax=Brevibacterium sp. VCM10 TaxID=1381751 RepID=UPI000471A23A|nr:nitroreductase [Brevibacterium sp. VCM10]
MTEGRDVEALDRLLGDRYSCRAYLPDPVPRATIERIFELGRRSASWCNVQPWQVRVLSGDATDRFRAALLDWSDHAEVNHDIAHPERYEGVHRQRRRDSAFQLYSAVGVEWGNREQSAVQARENFRLFGAPHVAVLSIPKILGPYAVLDTGVYLGTLMLAARSLGVDTTPQAALSNYSEQIRDHLSIPEDENVVAGLSFGYADDGHPANSYRTPRADLAETVTWVD